MYVEKYSHYSDLDNLTSEIAADLLSRVTIWPDGGMEIQLNYLDDIPVICNRDNSAIENPA